MPTDVLALPSKLLSPVGKNVFQALGAEARGTSRPVWISDSEIARRIGSGRGSVIAGRAQLEELKLIGKEGIPVNQVQGYRILHPMYVKASHRRGAAVAEDGLAKPSPRSKEPPAICSKCFTLCRRLMKVGWCRKCNTEMNTEKLVRRVVHEEIDIIAKSEETA